jgi:hypothetical protein
MINQVRNFLAKASFRKDASGIIHARNMMNLADARCIGIMYVLNDVADYDIVAGFVSRLQHERKEVKALGFVKNKILISRFLPKLSYDFFSRKDVTWYYKPIHSKVRDFIEKEFDILIDLNLQDFFPLKYISGLSKAKCRVGRYSESNMDFYDLMLEPKPGITMNEYIDQIHHYLSVINRNEKGVQ